MIVVDACVWASFMANALPDEHRATLTDRQTTPIGPPHVDFETSAALLRLERNDGLAPGVTAHDVIARFAAIPFERQRVPTDFTAAFDFITNASYADALYLAMARRLGCSVMSIDNGMIVAARTKDVPVIDARTAQERAEQADI